MPIILMSQLNDLLMYEHQFNMEGSFNSRKFCWHHHRYRQQSSYLSQEPFGSMCNNLCYESIEERVANNFESIDDNSLLSSNISVSPYFQEASNNYDEDFKKQFSLPQDRNSEKEIYNCQSYNYQDLSDKSNSSALNCLSQPSDNFLSCKSSISAQEGQSFFGNQKQQENDSFAKNKQSKHKNVVKNIGLGFKNFLLDKKSHFFEELQDLLRENGHNLFQFRQWVQDEIKLDQKKEIYKALNIKHGENHKSSCFKKILLRFFKEFFEDSHAFFYLMQNKNIQDKTIHLEFIKHFVESAKNTDFLLKKWK